MEFKTKNYTFTLLSADVSENAVSVTFYQDGKTQEEFLEIFKSSDETATMHVNEKELTGYTEFVSLQMQNSTGIKKEDDKNEDLLAIVRLKKPDLTAEKLKAALIHLSLTTGNSEIAEGIDV